MNSMILEAKADETAARARGGARRSSWRSLAAACACSMMPIACIATEAADEGEPLGASREMLVTAVGDPGAYVRRDGVSVVLHRTSNNHIRELSLGGAGWDAWDLSAVTGAAAAASDPFGYVRGDRVNAVIYRSSGDGHIRELTLDTAAGTPWQKWDLTASTGAPAAVGKPFAFVRRDGVTSVVYRSSGDNHIRELALTGSGWQAGDLSALTGAPAAGSDPVGYLRSDGVSAVVYRSAGDNHIRELTLDTAAGTPWQKWDLSASTGAPAAAGKPFVYLRSDGVSAVVYRSLGDNHIRELALLGSGWQHGDLSAATGAPAAASDPVAYIRHDGVTVVAYRSSGDNHIRELTLSNLGWLDWDLSASTGAPAAAGTPAAYRRADNVSAVLFRSSSDSHVRELALTGSGWEDWDLTVSSD
ncbi:hypothetical protein [Sorangium sp. So ce341]|uniref:hypothetical protein n=1 Tax=Sorangium sp. So ce341 TaxID=3133302 RepID=UPI003F6355EB